MAPNQEEKSLSGGQTDHPKHIEPPSDVDSETISKLDNASQGNDDKRKPVVSKAMRNAGSSQAHTHIEEQEHEQEQQQQEKQEHISECESACISSESDFVSSTNKEDEETASQPTQSQSNVNEQKESDCDVTSDEKSESTAYEESEDVSYSQSEQTDSKSESTFTSQDVSEETNVHNEHTSDDFDQDDADDVRERRNPKFSSEREQPQQFDDTAKPKNFPQHFPRNRHMRPQLPRPNHPYGGAPTGPDFNSSFMPQFRGARRPLMPPGSQPDFMRGHNMNMMRGPPNHMQRMPPGMQPHPSRMPVGPGHMVPPHQRMQRPPFQSPPTMFGNNQGMPPQGTFLRNSLKRCGHNLRFIYFVFSFRHDKTKSSA